MKQFFYIFVFSLLSIACLASQNKITIPPDVNVYCNIEYFKPDPNTSLLLNLYVPQSPNPLPLIIWIHGGGWGGGTKDYVLPQDFKFLEHGFAIASVEYRFTDKSPFPAQIQDCRAAVRFLRVNAAKYNLNPGRFGAWGASAGGHLVALLGTAADNARFDHPADKYRHLSPAVQAVCDWFGPTDLTRIDTDPNSDIGRSVLDMVSKLVGGPLKTNVGKARDASPFYYISKNSSPFFIVHGTDDLLVPLGQSTLFHDALIAAEIPSQLKIIPKAGHGGPAFSDPNLVSAERSFFNKYLKD
jgi:acetyl esterase/lipase